MVCETPPQRFARIKVPGARFAFKSFEKILIMLRAVKLFMSYELFFITNEGFQVNLPP